MKTCIICGNTLNEDLFPTIRIDKKTGKIYTRNHCKECHKIVINKTNHKNNNLMVDTIRDHKIIPENKINCPTEDNICKCGFTQNDIKVIKALINANTITDHKNNNLMVNTIRDHNFDKKSRIKVTYNIEKNIKDKLNEYCSKNMVINSDIVNVALIEFLNKYDNER
jgi:hypothetical protein